MINNMRNNREVYKSKHLSIQTKVRYFNCYESSIFLYNCALWTLTPTLAKSIDSFHCKLLRKAINFQYPKIISNKDLYHLTMQTPWSEIIEVRRMRLLGHICRLSDETPVKQALKEALKCQRNKIGRPKTTWIKQIKKDLEKRGIAPDNNFTNIMYLAQDRDKWRKNYVKSYDYLHDDRQTVGVGCG